MSLFFHRIAGSAAAGAFGAFALLALGGQHVQRDKEQDDAAGDLESGLGDVEIAENPGAAQGEEQHDGGGDGGALERGAQLSGAVLRLGHGKEDRRVADRVDHHEIDDEGCDETLEHGLSIAPVARRIVHTIYDEGDMAVKGRRGGCGCFWMRSGMLFGLDRHAVFPLYDGARDQVRRALPGAE